MRTAARVVGSGRRSLDYNGVWTEIDEDWLTVTVIRPPVTIEQRIPIVGTGSGSLVLPLEPLRRVVLSRRSGDAEFEGDNESIEFRSRAFRAELLAIRPDSVLPPDGPVNSLNVADLGGEAFRAGLDHTALSISHHYGWRPDLAGLEITAQADTLQFAATDMETLAIAEFRDPLAENLRDSPLILPPEALEDLGRHLPKRRRVEVRMGAHQVDFVAGDTSIRVENLFSSFPDYEPMRTNPTTRLVKVQRKALRRAVEQVSILSNGDRPARAWLTFATDTITVRTLDRQVGSGSKKLRAELHGEPCALGFTCGRWSRSCVNSRETISSSTSETLRSVSRSTMPNSRRVATTCSHSGSTAPLERVSEAGERRYSASRIS
ncbi:MAG: DNA polymerase III sliding clamp (beta) subunit (PCNA family) [Candidatus Aldehydirespiratoraceae bacterium]|jgi:DNA polymerase III sliding clamp (beta) subunit (PCNA family)